MHVANWAALRDMLWPGDGIEAQFGEIADWLAGGDEKIAFVAIEASTVVGFAEASVRYDPVNGCETSPVVFLEGIAVDSHYRRRGVATALGQAVEEWARLKGCSELGSDSDEKNAEGQALHRAIGFEERERVIFYRKLL